MYSLCKEAMHYDGSAVKNVLREIQILKNLPEKTLRLRHTEITVRLNDTTLVTGVSYDVVPASRPAWGAFEIFGFSKQCVAHVVFGPHDFKYRFEDYVVIDILHVFLIGLVRDFDPFTPSLPGYEVSRVMIPKRFRGYDEYHKPIWDKDIVIKAIDLEQERAESDDWRE